MDAVIAGIALTIPSAGRNRDANHRQSRCVFRRDLVRNGLNTDSLRKAVICLDFAARGSNIVCQVLSWTEVTKEY